jgi:hypothetical protein
LVLVLSLAVVGVVSGLLIFGQGSPAKGQLPTQVSQSDPSGLRLDLSISQNVVSSAQPLLISVDSYNPASGYLNVTASNSWPLQGLKVGACYSSVYPFGVAVYKGYYALSNVTLGNPLEVFPLVPCPMLIRLVTGYNFDPNSSNATIMPGTGPSVSISSSVTVSGTFPGQGTKATPLPAGTYTVAAGDEWGTLVLLHFRVR